MSQTLWQRIFPHPFLTVVVFWVWVALAQRLAFGTLLFAALLAVIVPKIIADFVVATPRVRWHLAAKLCLVVLYDIVVSNFRVAKWVLRSPKTLQSKWIRVPLASEHEQVNSLLAMIITTTPGTVSAGIDLEHGDILVHCLNTTQPEQDVQDIKDRYERPLLAIFRVDVGDIA